MSTRWTPGPWIADEMYMEDDRRTRISAYNGRGDYYHCCPTICEAYVSDDDGRDDPHIGVVTAEANARLIAAAPDLYDGCGALLGLIDLILNRSDISPELRDVLTTNHRISEAEAARAKARGEAA